MTTGLRMMRPSEMSLRMACREFALLISLTSFGSSQTLFLPQPITSAASRFCVVRLTLFIWLPQCQPKAFPRSVSAQ